MLERTLRKDRTAAALVLPADTPAQGGKRAVTAEPPTGNSRSSRYLAAGDYWFDNDSAQGGEGPHSRLHS
ncbi:hypothetical protein [Streptomyces sp. NRRL S-378]|uniref:hypothetical protein n=1 Tax=Streptomyces sp. NRRL S-378 TaxID=1463904 RepID=UPI0004C5E957|nr:hypothetical protein [Streptomyces sp. NRRL S-378]